MCVCVCVCIYICMGEKARVFVLINSTNYMNLMLNEFNAY